MKRRVSQKEEATRANIEEDSNQDVEIPNDTGDCGDEMSIGESIEKDMDKNDDGNYDDNDDENEYNKYNNGIKFFEKEKDVFFVQCECQKGK